VGIHYEEALHKVYVPLPLPLPVRLHVDICQAHGAVLLGVHRPGSQPFIVGVFRRTVGCARAARVGHGLGSSMDWIGLGQSFLIFGALGWVET